MEGLVYTFTFSHAAMSTHRYEQLWYKHIPHDFEKLILNQWSLKIKRWKVVKFVLACEKM